MLSGLYMSAQVTRADYQRADTAMKCASRVYSPAIRPIWVDSTHYFYYKNHEKNGDFYYLVNAVTGKQQKSSSKKGLAAFAGKDKQLKSSLLNKDEPQPFYYEMFPKITPMPVISPDKQWKAYIKDNNVYVSHELKKGEIEEFALSMDGTVHLRYDSTALIWSPDSKKLATLKIHDVTERRIPLIESSPSTQKQPILQWRNYAKPGDVLPVASPVLFDVANRKQISVDASLYENQYALSLTGWRNDSRAFTFEFNQRGHQRYIVGEVNAVDGTIRHLVDEKTKTFIYYNNNFRYDLNDGKEILWISERDGWRHLYLIDGITGTVKKQVTQENGLSAE